jgi:threonine/homoserine/homoserine lactone efflux protein
VGWFLRGLLIGVGIAAPVGPIGVLCIRRSVAAGWRAGFTCGLGAATADASYGIAAAFGLDAIATALTGHLTPIRLGGGLFLIVLGVRTFRRRPAEEAPRETGGYLSTVLLTLSNPTTILSFAAIFAGLGLGSRAPGAARASVMVAGVFCGSGAWWLALSGVAASVRHRMKERQLVLINRISAAIIVSFGVAAIVSALL